ncbi:Tripartite tricarboxylate transporter family receptor [Bacillus sp. THAF10]|uniref:tripartite tricarboxylate transporter substrate binding protein n=1 Tax=Bacillus sp. THAF10 TaxID=2587848 RepID=UPI001269746D|nr:tripartite tricarboxylate transporter substrate binding protein [Bacillus sp. THAF10]QFT89078.1 Tripartite tricarboxylate transporter family receptor [Bacillus sp. THAF10]
MKGKKKVGMVVLSFILGLTAACSSSSGGINADGTWEPKKPIEMVAPAGAGGGWDTTARMVSQTFEQENLIDKRMPVVNKPGGGGAVAWSSITKKEGDPYHLFVSSPPLLLVPLNGQSENTFEDFTPIANVIADYGAFAVRADAKWNNLNELFDDMKNDPGSITVIGVSSPGSMDHIQFVKIAKAAGVDITKIKYVSEQDGGTLTALLNGSVDVYSAGTAETVEQVKAGKIKVLGITAEERLKGEVLEDFPTAKEQGINETFVNWRGFFGPPNMDQAAVDYYVEKFSALNKSKAWDDIRKKYGWNELFMTGEEYKDFLKKENEEMQKLLDELGLGEQ